MQPNDVNDEIQELNDEQLDGFAGGVCQEDDWDDPRERDHSDKEDDPKDV